jgi:hypothetical protein
MSARHWVLAGAIAAAGAIAWMVPTLAAAAAPPKVPAGLYVHVDIEFMLKQGHVDKQSETQKRPM